LDHTVKRYVKNSILSKKTACAKDEEARMGSRKRE